MTNSLSFQSTVFCVRRGYGEFREEGFEGGEDEVVADFLVVADHVAGVAVVVFWRLETGRAVFALQAFGVAGQDVHVEQPLVDPVHLRDDLDVEVEGVSVDDHVVEVGVELFQVEADVLHRCLLIPLRRNYQRKM